MQAGENLEALADTTHDAGIPLGSRHNAVNWQAKQITSLLESRGRLKSERFKKDINSVQSLHRAFQLVKQKPRYS